MWLDTLSSHQTWVIGAYAAMSAVTFAAYGFDKSAALRSRRRVPEAMLHLLELLGGWPGALLAMRVFRHKRRKISFFVIVWLIAVAHVAAWTWMIWRAV